MLSSPRAVAPDQLLAAGGDLLVVPFVIAAGLVYWRGVSRLWRRGGVGQGGVGVRQALAFYAGLLTVVAAVASPLDALAHTLFSGHMAQHMLLVVVAAPLLAYGAPGLGALWSLPLGPRKRVGALWSRGTVRSASAAITHPAFAWLAFATVQWAWHLPALYQAAVLSPLVHALEHATMLLSAVLFWWVLMQPLGRRMLSTGAAVLYLFTTSLHVTLLGAMLSVAPRPLYPVYEVGALLWGLPAVDDQRLAAIVMRTPMALVFLVAVAVTFLRWLASMERRAGPDASLAGPEA